MTLEQALISAVTALWALHLWHLNRLSKRVDNCESARKKTEKRLEGLEQLFLQASCGVFGCDVRKRLTSAEALKRIHEMEERS